MAQFEKRRIGRTPLEVTTLGLGCATLGGTRAAVSREEAEAIVRAAWAAGVRYIDTAPFYGLGRAERCVGDAMRDVPRDEWVLSTKVGRLLRPRPRRRNLTIVRCRSTPFMITPTTASCARSRTACSVSA